jgi:hypothetical protein
MILAFKCSARNVMFIPHYSGSFSMCVGEVKLSPLDVMDSNDVIFSTYNPLKMEMYSKDCSLFSFNILQDDLWRII